MMQLIYEDSNQKTYLCDICGAHISYTKPYNNKPHHGKLCGIYWKKYIEYFYGSHIYNLFKSKYASARTRCKNSNCKDYARYHLLEFGYPDFPSFVVHEFRNFMSSVMYFGTADGLTIDRLDNSLGYIPGNIRFVPMRDNLRNRDCCKKVKCKNLKTNNIQIFDNCMDAARYTNIGSNSRVFECCNRNNHVYKNLYEFTYA